MRRAALVFLVALSACSSSTSAPPTQEPTQDAAPPATTPTITFATRATADGADQPAASSAFWGDVIVIRVRDLPPRAKVTLRAISKLRDGFYTSSATYEASDAGDVDTLRDAPLDEPGGVPAGTAPGPDVDRLLWSMAKTTVEPDEPLDQWALRVDVEVDSVRVARGTLGRFLVREGVQRTEVNEGGIVGVLYAPNDGEKHPAILAFGGSEGGLLGGESYAAYWSALGYTVLGVAYFGAPGLPDYLDQIPVEYFSSAIDWLATRPEADTTRLAVMGGSRGGELALLLGANEPRVKAVVAELPSGVLWGAPRFSGPEAASWTLGSVGLPFVPGSKEPPKKITAPDGTILRSDTPIFEAAIAAATADQLDSATPRVEKTAGPVLMLAGGDDQLWPSCDLAKFAMDRLVAGGHATAHGDALHCYEGAGHNVGMPGNPTLLADRAYHPFLRQWLALGGTPQGISRASRAADGEIRRFLTRAIGE